MQRRPLLTGILATVVLVVAWSTTDSFGGVINVDFNVSNGTSVGTYTGLGAAGAAGGSTWTPVVLGAKLFTSTAAGQTTTFTSGDLDSTVAGLQTITLTRFAPYDVSFGEGNPANRSAAFASQLLTDYLYNPPETPTALPTTFTIANLLAGKYELYVYAQNGGYYSADGTPFTITGATPSSATINNSTNLGGPTTGIDSEFVLNGNYAKFSITIATNGGSIVGSLGGSFAPFNGFQLIPVPEPSSAGLLAVGIVLVSAGRRRFKGLCKRQCS